ncbi:MAG: hypothetical protein CL677_00535 [Bdellovibrionaceae bacterium]|nr:hypothetical protein [Pseudobdellovibrionaceae bacterium]
MRYTALFVFFSLLLPSLVWADNGVRQQYATIEYVIVDLDGVDDNMNGIGIASNWIISDDFVGGASFSKASVSDVDVTAWSIGAAYVIAPTPIIDINLGVSLLNSKVDASGADSDTESDVGVGATFKIRPAEVFQLEAGLSLVEDTTTLSATGRFFFGEDFGVSASIASNDDATSTGVGLNWFFK